MNDAKKEQAIKDLQQIPGIGKSLSQMLYNIGITSTTQLKNKSPERLYRKLCDYQASPVDRVDRCVLYVFRCAVYFASNSDHDEEKLLWWNWKDQTL
ncbi:MAG: DUF4332 domain-containing protein [Planctomycetes bacterium]|nr:DUF4332 domain-containing protein [Planctomycetota bacterium]